MQRTIRSLAFAVAALAITTQSASAGQFKKAVYYHTGQLPRHVAARNSLEAAMLIWFSPTTCRIRS